MRKGEELSLEKSKEEHSRHGGKFMQRYQGKSLTRVSEDQQRDVCSWHEMRGSDRKGQRGARDALAWPEERREGRLSVSLCPDL